MKTLTNKELVETNGGGLFNNNNSSGKNTLLGTLSIGNLLSTSSESHDGDESSKSSTSLGNGINLNLGGLFDRARS